MQQVFITIKITNGKYNVAFRVFKGGDGVEADVTKGFELENLEDLMVEIKKRLQIL